ncbi:MAG: hypothetical protein HFJ50_09410 [Clostridia bacterium]|nr:hypothetical protein [Clostridia bacterium]
MVEETTTKYDPTTAQDETRSEYSYRIKQKGNQSGSSSSRRKYGRNRTEIQTMEED